MEHLPQTSGANSHSRIRQVGNWFIEYFTNRQPELAAHIIVDSETRSDMTRAEVEMLNNFPNNRQIHFNRTIIG